MSRTGSPNFSARCACGYTSKPLTINGRSEPATCSGCQNFVVTSRKRFTYDYAPCSQCGAPLGDSNLFGRGWLVFAKACPVACPKCGQSSVELTPLPGSWEVEDDMFPSPGEEIQATLRPSGKIVIPDLHTESGSVWFTQTPRLPVGTTVYATVIAISTTAVNAGLVEVAHHRGVKDLELAFNGIKSGG